MLVVVLLIVLSMKRDRSGLNESGVENEEWSENKEVKRPYFCMGYSSPS